jgi:uncharacterized coiled-coil protein SlyX
MAWNLFLTGAGALAGLAGLAISAIEPQFDYELAAPSQATPVLYQASPNVSVQFHDTSVGDVLSWLEKQGVSFVVSDPKLKERTITLNIQNQPLDEVVDAIANALGGHWDRKGNIRIYKDGEGFGMYSFTMPQIKTFDKNYMDGLPVPDGGQGTWNVVPPALPDGKLPQVWNVPPGQPGMQQFRIWSDDPKARELEKQLDELRKNPDQNSEKIKELEKKLGELRKSEVGGFAFGDGNGPEVWNMPPGQFRIWGDDPKAQELEKQLKELRKNPDLNDEKIKELQKKLSELRKSEVGGFAFGEGSGQGTWNVVPPAGIKPYHFSFGFDLDRFTKSLSDKQKELMKSQGYLKIDDLTDEQRSQLGIVGHPEHFELDYSKDGQDIVIKSK